jgi:hypothetical protein
MRRFVFTLFLLLSAGYVYSGAITPDVMGSWNTTFLPAEEHPSTYTFQATVNTGNYLTVQIECEDFDLHPRVTFNGVSMTQLTYYVSEIPLTHIVVHIYGLANPSAGTHTVSITVDDGGIYMNGLASSWNGVGSVGGASYGTIDDSAGPLTYSCPTTTGQLVIDSSLIFLYTPTYTATQGVNQTLIDKAVTGFFTLVASSYQTATGSSTDVTWTWIPSGSYARSCCVALIPSGVTTPQEDNFLRRSVFDDRRW